MIMAEVLDKALNVLLKYPLCDNCLGRLFARLGRGITNAERGRSIKNLLHMKLHEMLGSTDERARWEALRGLEALARSGHLPSMRLLGELGIHAGAMPCHLCGGSIFGRLSEFAHKVYEALSKLNIEFHTFEIGTKIPKEVLTREIELTTEFNIATAESIKRELNREIGKVVKEMIGKEHDKANPDVVATVDVETGSVDIEVKPMYIYARYRKPYRGVSQAQRMPGVVATIQSTLSTLLGKELGSERAILHAAGREDVDVRMLGSGRPTVIQLVRPSRRPRDAESISKILSRMRGVVELTGEFRVVSKAHVLKIKEAARDHAKVYRALVALSSDVDDNALRSLEQYFRNRQVTQYTPQRIRRKRVKRRVRVVYSLSAKKVAPGLVELLIKCQGGLYVKEFIHGDGGRTQPSVAGTLGVEAMPIELDVLDVLETPS